MSHGAVLIREYQRTKDDRNALLFLQQLNIFKKQACGAERETEDCQIVLRILIEFINGSRFRRNTAPLRRQGPARTPRGTALEPPLRAWREVGKPKEACRRQGSRGSLSGASRGSREL
ncbi:hypothetical protein E2C01_053742 [Portunus trituberculatus]|uniref:Uncharacterized protein n=1 Tax=Portunus trituberculatus TaxID=210409 RepID=A0A5B7GQW6_PORTR|nr:hypothetical protein [Portunus trituberculatus]